MLVTKKVSKVRLFAQQRRIFSTCKKYLSLETEEETPDRKLCDSHHHSLFPGLINQSLE